jgi:hypothetical protein
MSFWRRFEVADLRGLPGADLVAEGLSDHAARRETPAALLVAIAGARLRRLGFAVDPAVWDEAELRLYRLLSAKDARGAYGHYNSLLRRIDSFARAVEREHGKAARTL